MREFFRGVLPIFWAMLAAAFFAAALHPGTNDVERWWYILIGMLNLFNMRNSYRKFTQDQ